MSRPLGTAIVNDKCRLVTGDLDRLNQKFAERLCNVGTPRGPVGTIQSIHQRRGKVDGVYGAKVIMLGTGTTRYFAFGDIYPS